MTDCLVAGENRAGLLLNSSAPSFPARFFPAPRRAALPPGQPPRLLSPVLPTSVWVPWSIAERFPLFPSASTLPRRSAFAHGSMTDCLDADEEPCRAFTKLKHSTSPGTLLFLHLGARYYLPGSLYVCFTPCCARQFGRLVIPCIGIPHSFKCAFSGRIYPLVVQYF